MLTGGVVIGLRYTTKIILGLSMSVETVDTS